MGESISPFPPKNHLQLFQANVMSLLYGLLMRLSITFDFQSLLPSNFCSWKSQRENKFDPNDSDFDINPTSRKGIPGFHEAKW